ncbi:amidohydrolase [Microdochium trichocladiopsis]|uniref:Amidohydrolase n=1 Tax=Microdochium trichocladiopsis TaxID=1682393 RepID=A0A9P8YJ21_9PEZI|nr:amidohydrolase [Microdochium trichocladiopsis]KAH7039940.1 amidohydrolase [Microdochium trichocladiopsis]
MVRRAVACPERQPAEQPAESSTYELPARITSRNHKSSKDKKKKTTIIKADILIPGAGEPQHNAALVIQDKTIAWVGPSTAIPAAYTSQTPSSRVHHVPVAIPGLWDVHVHVEAEPPEDEQDNPADRIVTHPATAGAQIARGCWEALQRGYTSLRDLAGYGCEIARAIDSGAAVGPHIYAAGACLSQTGGHGDIFQIPAGTALLHLGVGATSLIPGTQYAGGSSVLVDGVDECRRAVRLQIRRGARCIKIMASGGVGSRDDDVYCAQFSREELECIVSEAARQKVSCAAHVHSKEGIMAALQAGVRSVEHVSFADRECVDLIREKKVVWVATRTVNEILKQTKGRGLPRNVWEKAKKVSGASLEAYKMAIADGEIAFALGTDTAPGFNMAMELDYAVQAGMTNLEAIKAATANGPLTLGEKAPLSGQLKVGYDADVLGVLANPADDVKVLMDKHNIGWVWKGGRLFKGPGVGPWGEEE